MPGCLGRVPERQQQPARVSPKSMPRCRNLGAYNVIRTMHHLAMLAFAALNACGATYSERAVAL